MAPAVEFHKSDQIEAFKNLLLQEDWKRLPLPDDFTIKELEDPLMPFQSNLTQFLQALCDQTQLD